ncbi:competence protein [Flavobacterium psychrotolerans]|uniref:Competence protein n=1 Tax=Flavobacterium psychrotolerans TaxID=2169410 RepID=A0A2U1JP34_9FLAO|nr:competence protein [Flavobacterium psychrotolerans]PWA06937.1 competence protein [Flavobacterium psychrotolerans]
MAFEGLKENAEIIQDQAQAFIESNVAYYKLWGFKVAMKSVTMILKFILVSFCFCLVLLFFSIAGAIAIGKAIDSYALGFLIVGGVYLLVMGLIFLFKNKIVEGPILEKFSEIFFND